MTPWPLVFYEKQTITRFDSSGNPYGTSALFRQDGVNGQKYIILKRTDVHRLDSAMSTYSVQGNEVVQTLSTDNNTVSTSAFDFSGIRQGEATANLVMSTYPAALVNAENTVKSVVSEQCATAVTEGPCPMTFSLSIERPVGTLAKTLKVTDFPNAQGSNLYAIPVAFSKDGTILFLFVTEAGDSFGQASFHAVDTRTYSITQLLATHHENNTGAINNDGLTFLRTSVDGGSIFVQQNFNDSQKATRLLKITLEPWHVQTISDVSSGLLPFMIKPDDSGIIQQKSDGGFAYTDFTSGTTNSLTQKGYFLQWSHDGKYYLYRVYDDIHNGLGPYNLMASTLATGKQIFIVRQSVTAQSYGTSTRAGDILYAPVGIW